MISNEEQQPDWMVSAGKVSGAASRRTGNGSGSKAKRQEKEKVETPANESSIPVVLQSPQVNPSQQIQPPVPVAAPTQASVLGSVPGSVPAQPYMQQGQPIQPRQSQQPQSSQIPPPGTSQQAPVAQSMRQPSKQGGSEARSSVAFTVADSALDDDEEEIIPLQKPKKKKSGSRNSNYKKKKKQKSNTSRIIKYAVFAACAVLLVIGLTMGVRKYIELQDIKNTLDRGRDVFYENIYMNDIPLQGMTLDQAAETVNTQVNQRLSSFKITLRTVDGRTWDISKDDLKMQYDVANQLDQLWAIGHIGNASDCYNAIKALEENEVRRYSTMTYDLSSVNQILTQIKEEVDEPAINATRVDDDTKWPPYSYTDDSPGQTLDITGLNEQIIAMVDRLESGTVDLTPVKVEAKVTRKDLEGSIVKLATYETAVGATSHEGRFTNIQIGTEKFNHLIVHSGESVSFNRVAGKRTEANGYVEAPEIAYGQYVMGIGGGICQVSSTLYNAVINAGLEVTKRTQHSLASNYVPMGQDATVSDDRLDFIFKNNTNADIFFETSYYKKKNYWYTSFTIYGRPDPNGYSYKLESQVREEIPIPDPTYRPDRTATYVVYDNETKLISKGEKGYIVDVYLVTTDSNGLQISRDLKYTDTYKAITPVYWVGVTPRITSD